MNFIATSAGTSYSFRTYTEAKSRAAANDTNVFVFPPQCFDDPAFIIDIYFTRK